MSADDFRYLEITDTGVFAAADTRRAIQLFLDGAPAPGTWEIVRSYTRRTLGVAAATYSTEIREGSAGAVDNSAFRHTIGLGAAADQLLFGAGAAAIIQTDPTGNISWLAQPNVGGDTFQWRALLRRRQVRP